MIIREIDLNNCFDTGLLKTPETFASLEASIKMAFNDPLALVNTKRLVTNIFANSEKPLLSELGKELNKNLPTPAQTKVKK